MAFILRKLVSKKKKRYVDKDNGFDLDMAYITNQIIAMGYPSESLESLYRNPMPEVKRFFEFKHPGKYKLWSLTAETNRRYDKSHFHGRVEDAWQFYDHEAPPFDILLPFCQSVHQWLTADPGNVAAIHCKAGKGRTGVMISVYLMYNGSYPTAEKAMHFYAVQRTFNMKGVTIPSQRRSIQYFERFLSNQVGNGTFATPHPGQRLKIKRLTLTSVPIGGCTLGITVFDANFKELFTTIPKDSSRLKNMKKYEDTDKNIVIDMDVPVEKDFKIVVNKEKKGKFTRIFQFWANTEFIDNNMLVLQKHELDKAYKDCKEHKKYTKDFQVVLEFEPDATKTSKENGSGANATTTSAPLNDGNLVVI